MDYDKLAKKKLSKEEFHILREKGTEMPFSGKYVKHDEKGIYHCKLCGESLFSSEDKFDSHCGWPSFSGSVKEKIQRKIDFSFGMIRLEILCKKCGSHLGHFFPDGPKLKRYCVNSASINFKKKSVRSSSKHA